MSTAHILPFSPATQPPEPRQPAGLLAEALEELCRGNSEAAERLCMSFLSENTHDADAFYVFALANVQGGHLQVAERALVRALKLRPGFDEASRALTDIAHQARRQRETGTGCQAC